MVKLAEKIFKTESQKEHLSLVNRLLSGLETHRSRVGTLELPVSDSVGGYTEMVDALILLARAPGELVTKDRFLEEVWRGVPVTDEALTQCIRSLRSALGDKARDPRFIETVPKHGYRFVGEVRREEIADGPSPKRSAEVAPLHKALALLWRAMIGGTGAGIIGGVLYGMIGLPGAPGALSALLVMVALCGVVGVLAGLGVGAGLGIAAYFAPHSRAWQVGGAALGGGLVGAMSELLGVDAFTLLFGRAPSDMTGLPEGLTLGCAIGCALLVVQQITL